MEVEPETCYGDEQNAFTSVLEQFNNSQTRQVATSNIEVTYIDFPENAKASFEKAVNIWETFLVTNQVIRIKATWQTLANLTLAQSGATRIYNNFTNVPVRNVWYPVALAEAIANRDLNNGDFDINVNVNNSISWSYDLTGKPVGNRFDLVTVVLHEIAHGLGFNSSFGLTDDSSQGKWGQSLLPYIYDTKVVNLSNQKLNDTRLFGNPSEALKNELISGSVFFEARNASFSEYPQLSATNPFKSGGSISHLEETRYPLGNENSLMTPSVRASEVVHTPGQVTLKILNQLGWPINNLNTSNNVITAVEEVNPLYIQVFPNPSSDILTIKLSNPNNLNEVSLLDLRGVLLHFSTINSTEFSLNLSSLSSGIYFLVFKGDKYSTTKKIIHSK